MKGDCVIVEYNGEKHEVEVKGRDENDENDLPWRELSIRHIKIGLENKIGVPVASQRLFYGKIQKD